MSQPSTMKITIDPPVYKRGENKWSVTNGVTTTYGKTATQALILFARVIGEILDGTCHENKL